MKNPPFFITGLPRSRTAWLANLLWNGETVCEHELSAVHSTYQAFREDVRNMACGEYNYGVSDTGILLFEPAKMLLDFPDSKFLFVRRSLAECKASFERSFKKRISWEIWGRLALNLDSWILNAGPQGMVIHFDDMDLPENTARISRHIGAEINPLRREMLKRMRVEIIPGKWLDLISHEKRAAFNNLPPS